MVTSRWEQLAFELLCFVKEVVMMAPHQAPSPGGPCFPHVSTNQSLPGPDLDGEQMWATNGGRATLELFFMQKQGELGMPGHLFASLFSSSPHPKGSLCSSASTHPLMGFGDPTQYSQMSDPEAGSNTLLLPWSGGASGDGSS